MACTNWPDGGGQRSGSAGTSAAQVSWNKKDWWNDASWGRPWNADLTGRPSRTASAAPSATKTPHTAPAKAAAPRLKATAPWRIARTTAPEPGITAWPGTTPRKPGITATPGTTAPQPSTTATPSATATPSTTATPSAQNPTATASAASPKPSSTPTATATASGAVARVVELVNAERGKVGCSALTLNTTLSKVAQAHSEDMALHQNMSHSGSDGSSPGDRLTDAGYAWSAYGENVAYGYASPEQVMAGWMASPGHKANILNCAFKEIGVGLAQPDSYWTQDFGTPR
ncbi:CAP domain-containing protein [Streptomyces shenzhenensis]|uniref:CAP domain-containing protein n=1 Tax=Streptomyces shenzhenensis TaxID=943815 RepID=UPI0028683288|nr:CAP domain-containing protein [Streptomyces shenzhenensis]